jgi:hypothetical protein
LKEEGRKMKRKGEGEEEEGRDTSREGCWVEGEKKNSL